MPRRIPNYADELQTIVDTAMGIVRAGEISRRLGGHPEWYVARLEALYELAFLRTFAAWEAVLEAVFIRSLCGYAFSGGQERLIAGATFLATIGAAEASLMPPRRPYMLWHNPSQVIARYDSHFQFGPGMPEIQRTVVASAHAYLESLARIRHRIAHDQNDAKTKFDAVTATLAGRTYRGSRPGRFLRDSDSSVPPRKWIEVTTNDLVNLARQLY